MTDLTLETERLLLRPWKLEDAEDMYEYAKDPEIGPNAGWKPHESVEESRTIIQSWIALREEGKELELALVLKGSGKVIGSLGLTLNGWRNRIPFSCSMGYVLGKNWWGRGLMTEAAQTALDYAFGALGMRILMIDHYPENKRSRRVIEKCGFTYEGTLRKASALYNGEIKDHCCYSMTAAEYWLLKAKKAGLSLKLPEELSMQDIEAYRFDWAEEKIVPYAVRKQEFSDRQWLEHVIAVRTSAADPYVTSHLYFLVDSKGDLLGALALRHRLSESLLFDGGHIGYGIRPSQRGKGYAPRMLALGLEKAKEMGIDHVLITCDEENIASSSTIEDCGGILENKVFSEGELVRRYWIDQ